MNNATDVFKQYYETAIHSKKDWGFFLGLADYFGLIKETPELLPQIRKIFDEHSNAIKEIDKVEENAVKELQKVIKETLAIIKRGKIQKEGLSEALQNLEKLEKGEINPHHYKSSRLDDGLKGLIKLLSDSEEDFKKNYPKYGISKSLLVREGKSYELGRKKEVEIWGAYTKIQVVFRVIKEYNKHLAELEKNGVDTSDFKEMKKDLDLIERDGKDFGFRYIFDRGREREFSSSTDESIKNLKRDRYELYLTRLHNYFTKELNKLNKEKGTQEEDDKQTKRIILFLDKNGKLCKQNKKCYEMGEKSKRHKLIRFLAGNSDYQPTRLITETIGYKNNQTTSGEIGKIRKNIQRDLSIKGEEFLEGKKDSGYRINQKYKIKII